MRHRAALPCPRRASPDAPAPEAPPSTVERAAPLDERDDVGAERAHARRRRRRRLRRAGGNTVTPRVPKREPPPAQSGQHEEAGTWSMASGGPDAPSAGPLVPSQDWLPFHLRVSRSDCVLKESRLGSPLVQRARWGSPNPRGHLAAHDWCVIHSASGTTKADRARFLKSDWGAPHEICQGYHTVLDSTEEAGEGVAPTGKGRRARRRLKRPVGGVKVGVVGYQ